MRCADIQLRDMYRTKGAEGQVEKGTGDLSTGWLIALSGSPAKDVANSRIMRELTFTLKCARSRCRNPKSFQLLKHLEVQIFAKHSSFNCWLNK